MRLRARGSAVLQNCKTAAGKCKRNRWRREAWRDILGAETFTGGIFLMQILEVNGLRKVYTTRFGGASVEALKNINFSVENGEYSSRTAGTKPEMPFFVLQSVCRTL